MKINIILLPILLITINACKNDITEPVDNGSSSQSALSDSIPYDQWDASGFASGVYFYQLKTGNFVCTKKLILLR